MTAEIWKFEELLAASGGTADGRPQKPLAGFSIDTRSIEPGDVFVALKGARDGHEFVSTAFAAGASAAIVSDAYVRQSGDGALIKTHDTLAALENIGRAARARLSPEARVVAVTGSVGKTTTKDMLGACLARLGPTHAAAKSFNNHLGVPLTLARMPRDTRYGVFEIGMNHAGEIAPLTRMVRPDAAIVTTIEAVHIENFASVEDIARAKAEIFGGLEAGGAAVINADNPHCSILAAEARAQGARIVTFSGCGRVSGATVSADIPNLASSGGETDVVTERWRYRLAIPGAHNIMNSLAVVATLEAIGADVERALPAFAAMRPPAGRGTRAEIVLEKGKLLLVDESYNANPASMRAALTVVGTIPRKDWPRRIAVLGDMLELGPEAPALHAGLIDAVDAAGIDLVFAAGPNMARLIERVPEPRRGGWAPSSAELEGTLLNAVRSGDVVMIKGSNGSRMARLVEALRSLATERSKDAQL
ncbi:MAG: UDP-N-acetylmuramoyl-tripeptide--D-alanyl-D-alanine ligase [Hyphomicrobium sp.]|nr:UDP-N-acetylmuramoyl-tripeptide--D-alanyl-D-alanine ligase [Hyphomicrobium sp.]